MIARDPNTKRHQRLWSPGDAASVFTHNGLSQGDRVFLYVRVSRRQMRTKGVLKRDVESLCEIVEERGCVVTGIRAFVASGRNLVNFIESTFDAKHKDSKLVVWAVDRAARHPRYKTGKHHSHLRATQEQLDFIRRWKADGVELVSIQNPNATNAELGRRRSTDGQKRTGRRGGRPLKAETKKERKARLMPIAIQLDNKGLSVREISKLLDVPRSTISDWLAEARTGVSGFARDSVGETCV